MFIYGFSKPEDVTAFLSSKIKAKLRQYPSLLCGVYVKHNCGCDNSVVNINGDSIFPAASLIKIPVAVILLKKIDNGEISWDDTLTLKQNHYAFGTGYLRTKKAGTKIKLREVFKLMLTISDNTACNMIIDFLGGIQTVNQEISKLGLKNTKINNLLGDFKGTNKTSPRDLVTILEKSLEGNLLSSQSRKLFKYTLLHVSNKSLINKGLGRYTRFAHKTGTIGICIGDCGIIYFPFGKRIKIAVIVKRPFNSLQGKEILKEIGKLIYEYLG